MFMFVIQVLVLARLNNIRYKPINFLFVFSRVLMFMLVIIFSYAPAAMLA